MVLPNEDVAPAMQCYLHMQWASATAAHGSDLAVSDYQGIRHKFWRYVGFGVTLTPRACSPMHVGPRDTSALAPSTGEGCCMCPCTDATHLPVDFNDIFHHLRSVCQQAAVSSAMKPHVHTRLNEAHASDISPSLWLVVDPEERSVRKKATVVK